MNRFISLALCYGRLDKQRAKGFNKALLKSKQKACMNPIFLGFPLFSFRVTEKINP